jgi:ketosteroid isomerase-like protein
MKLLRPLLAGLAIAFTATVFSQQMVSTPSGLSETPTPAPAATPEATATPAVEKPAFRPAAPAKVEAAPAPASPVKKASAEAKPTPKAEPVAAKPSGKMSVEATLKEMENNWEAAIVAHDAAVVGTLVASDFAGIDSRGRFVNKSALIAAVKADKDTYESAKNERLIVHFYGPSIAVVTGSARARGTTKGGKAFERKYRFTDTWVQRDGTWKCVASQASLFGGK